MKKLLGIAIAVALIAIVLNDGGRYLAAWNGLDSIAQDCAVAAASTQSRDRNEAARAAVAKATPQGATVYLYDQNEATVHVWVEKPVTDTWVLERIWAPITGQPKGTVMKVTAEKTATWR